MIDLLRLTLLFTALLVMALLSAPNNSAAAPLNVDGVAYMWQCEKTIVASRRHRERCDECVRSCRDSVAYSAIGQASYQFSERCRVMRQRCDP